MKTIAKIIILLIVAAIWALLLTVVMVGIGPEEGLWMI